MNDYENALIHTQAEHRAWLTDAGFTDIVQNRVSGTYADDDMRARKT